ncbi:hypothetical protein Nepgr_007005 [Nepenthes gracilis]|uniref:Retrotransposon gag domain-containing protein n=1 Tax=Nepenthes gracilis TaxID=150966 RepID=A0AAD3S6F0_NEPGR|nr:hypothetical protein Nepgr_007005 [Nepenthes gracilis]
MQHWRRLWEATESLLFSFSASFESLNSEHKGASERSPQRSGLARRTSQAEAPQVGNEEGSRRERPSSRRGHPRTQVASSSRAPRRVEDQPCPRVQGESLERRHSEAQRNRRDHDDQEAVPRDALPGGARTVPEGRAVQEPYELRHYLNERRAAAPPRVEARPERGWNLMLRESSGGGANALQSPFSTEIRTRMLPPKFKMPNLELYDGSGDPMDHLNHFREHLSLQGLDETTMCQCFPLTLKGDAPMWFYGMSADSIRDFGDLATAFLSQFASSRRIPRLTDEVKLNAFLSALEGGAFFKHLIHKGLQTFIEAEVVARAYIAAEEANDAKRPERDEHPQQKAAEGKRKSGDYQSPQTMKKHHKAEQSSRREPRPIHLTPLNDSRTNVLMQIRGEKFLKWPKQLKNPGGGDQSKYCDFHRCGGHSTEDCRTLQSEIEELIRRGHLSRFIQRPGQASGPEDGGDAKPPRNRVAAGVVNMISSRPAGGDGHGLAAAKKPRTGLGSEDEVICFSSRDLDHVTSPHSDPLVVTALVSDGANAYQMKRVFVDNGSSRNLLYLDAFFKLGLKKSQMKAPEGPLYGLDNEPVPVQGFILLEVTLGIYPRTASKVLTFLVVDLPSVYNAILGRPCLAAFNAVTSIPHLKMKFPTLCGVGEVLGDRSTDGCVTWPQARGK